jgi:hypothetical protein
MIQMTERDLFESLKSRLQQLPSRWATDPDSQFDDLAYLALTSKIEHQIRDQLALSMQIALRHTPYFVHREWHRTDLAITKGSHAKLLVEIKSMATADVSKAEITSDRDYRKALQRDLDKMHKTIAKYDPGSPPTPLGALILTAVHLPKGLGESGRALHKDDRLTKLYSEKNDFRRQCLLNISAFAGHMTPAWTMVTGSWTLHALGEEVEVLNWLFGPFSLHTLTAATG